MRVLVCGGRAYRDRAKIWEVLDELDARSGPLVVIQGGASGADEHARQWCYRRRRQMENYPADWNVWGGASGPIRNQRMLDKGQPDLVLAFPGGPGTADMVERAHRAGVNTRQYPHFNAAETVEETS